MESNKNHKTKTRGGKLPSLSLNLPRSPLSYPHPPENGENPVLTKEEKEKKIKIKIKGEENGS